MLLGERTGMSADQLIELHGDMVEAFAIASGKFDKRIAELKELLANPKVAGIKSVADAEKLVADAQAKADAMWEEARKERAAAAAAMAQATADKNNAAAKHDHIVRKAAEKADELVAAAKLEAAAVVAEGASAKRALDAEVSRLEEALVVLERNKALAEAQLKGLRAQIEVERQRIIKALG